MEHCGTYFSTIHTQSKHNHVLVFLLSAGFFSVFARFLARFHRVLKLGHKLRFLAFTARILLFVLVHDRADLTVINKSSDDRLLSERGNVRHEVIET